MTLLLLLALSLVGLSGVLLLRTLTFGQRRRGGTLAQIDAYGFSATREPAAFDRRSVRATVTLFAEAIGTRILRRFGPASERGLRRMLDSAGFYHVKVETFLGFRVLGAAAFPLLIVVLAGGRPGLLALLAGSFISAFGWVLPRFLVSRRATNRLERVDREVPELVDLLVTAVEAGVAFAGALQLAARSIQGPLGDELRLMLREQSMGLTPQEALTNLGGRVDSPAVRAFVQALVQGETLGVSIGKVLRELAVDMRKRRRQAAEERAQKAPTKILFPLVVLLLPALFIVTLGPVVVTIMRTLGG